MKLSFQSETRTRRESGYSRLNLVDRDLLSTDDESETHAVWGSRRTAMTFFVGCSRRGAGSPARE